MKQKMKILTSFTLITLLLFNSSCEKDLYEDAIQQNKNFKFKTVNFSEVKKINAKTAQFIVNKINKNLNIQARTSELYGKTVDTTNINYLVKDDGYSSFTFKVENDSIGINYIENIIVENYPNQEQEVLLVKYNLNTSVEQFYSNDGSLQNSLTSTETSLYQNTTQSFSRYSCITVGYWTTVDKCEGELVTPGENPNCFNSDGTRATKEVFITLAEDCGFDSGGGGDGGNYGGDPNNGNYDNGSNGGGNYNGAGIFIPNIYNGDEDPNNTEFILAGQVSQYFNSLHQNIKALTNNNTWVYSYLVDYFRNHGNNVNTRNSQYATNALNNYYNFQLNSYNSNFLFVDLERFNFWAYYTFLNNNLLINNTQNVFDIRDFVMNTDSETAHNIINYLFFNKDNQEAIEFVKELNDYLIANPAMTWEIVMNNRTSFDTNEGEVDNYTSGGYDTTTYPTFNPQQQTWPSILPVIPQNQFVGWNRRLHPNWHCMDYSKEQLRVMGYQISSYYSTGQTFQIYTAQNGVNNTALSQGLSYLKYALSNGIPVIVGIDDAPGHTGNLDSTTDHFIVIVGMGTDSNGKYFQFYDNATGAISNGTSPLNKLYYNSSTGLISGTSQAVPYSTGLTYTITMIRKSKPL